MYSASFFSAFSLLLVIAISPPFRYGQIIGWLFHSHGSRDTPREFSRSFPVWVSAWVGDNHIGKPQLHVHKKPAAILRLRLVFWWYVPHYGRSDVTRTHGLLVPNQALYQTELHPVIMCSSVFTSYIPLQTVL